MSNLMYSDQQLKGRAFFHKPYLLKEMPITTFTDDGVPGITTESAPIFHKAKEQFFSVHRCSVCGALLFAIKIKYQKSKTERTPLSTLTGIYS